MFVNLFYLCIVKRREQFSEVERYRKTFIII